VAFSDRGLTRMLSVPDRNGEPQVQVGSGEGSGDGCQDCTLGDLMGVPRCRRWR
jgi:hypothetical protein